MKKKTGVERVPLDVRLKRLSKVDENGCWMWQGSTSSSGYPKIQMGRGKGEGPKDAHRVSYAVFNGEIPDGMVVDHLCYKEGGYSNRLCINPEHLSLTTYSENQRRGWARRKEAGHVHYKVKLMQEKQELEKQQTNQSDGNI